MSLAETARPDWEGGCVLRIHESIAALVEAAERNLVVIGREDCDAAQFGFPRDLMAKDFRNKALTLADDLLNPAAIAPGARPADRYPATEDIHVDVRCALDWLGDVFHQQMRYWGWIGAEDGEPGNQLVYRISEADLARLRRCLARLDDATERHRPPTDQSPPSTNPTVSPSSVADRVEARPKNGWETFVETWDAIKDFVPNPTVSKSHNLVQVHRIDGKVATLDLSTAAHWNGKPQFDMGYECSYDVDLYRTKGGRWVLYTGYPMLDGVFGSDAIPPEDQWEEITLEQATQWFISDWGPASDEESDSIPLEILEEIDRMDIDSQIQQSNEDASLKQGESKATRSGQGVKAETKGTKTSMKSSILGLYATRVRGGESLAVRDLAEAAGCSAGYVSKVLRLIPSDIRDAAPRGSKDRDGKIEAIA